MSSDKINNIGKRFDEISSTPRDGTGKVKDLMKNHILESIKEKQRVHEERKIAMTYVEKTRYGAFLGEQREFANQYQSDMLRYQREGERLKKELKAEEGFIKPLDNKIKEKDEIINKLKSIEKTLKAIADSNEIRKDGINGDFKSIEKEHLNLNEKYTQIEKEYNNLYIMHEDTNNVIFNLTKELNDKKKEHEGLSKKLAKIEMEQKKHIEQLSGLLKSKTSEQLKEEVVHREERLSMLQDETIVLEQVASEKGEFSKQIRASLEASQGDQATLELDPLVEKLKILEEYEKYTGDQKIQKKGDGVWQGFLPPAAISNRKADDIADTVSFCSYVQKNLLESWTDRSKFAERD